MKFPTRVPVTSSVAEAGTAVSEPVSPPPSPQPAACACQDLSAGRRWGDSGPPLRVRALLAWQKSQAVPSTKAVGTKPRRDPLDG